MPTSKKISASAAMTSFCCYGRRDPFPSRAQERNQGRSMVVSRGGIVASESPLASQAGVRILESGGNAVDAAIATNAMMGVVEPMMNGIGGDLFAIVYDAKANKLYGLNASGWAPKDLTIAYLEKQGIKSMPQRGINSVTVPGTVDGWQKLADKFGRKKLGEDLAPAIQTARDGFPVPEWDALYWAGEVDYLHGDEAATATYLPNDHPPKLGEIFRNPDLADFAASHRHSRPRRLLQRRHRDEVDRGHEASQRDHDGAGSLRIFRGMGRASLDDLPRLDRIRIASERAGNGRAGNAEHHGEIPARRKRLGIRLGEGASHR